MKLYLEPITVEPHAGMPRVIRWRAGCFRVAHMLDFWVFESRWWSGGERREYLLVLTDHGTLEIYHTGERWILSRIYD